MRDIIVNTKRLVISPQSMEELQALYKKETDSAMKQAYLEMLTNMGQLSGREEWGTNWPVCLQTDEVIGGIGFKGAPDTEGTVEIGYGIQEGFRGRGYATEAVEGVVKWALAQKGVNRITAQTEPNNAASQTVLLKNGFIRDGYGDEGFLYKIDC